jgi:hypothetical protein
MRAFKIRSAWDAGFALAINGRERWHACFAAAAAAAEIGGVSSPNVFDRAYASEIDTKLSHDGAAFVVELEGGESARVESFTDAELWLTRAIRARLPKSEFARNA